jgi:hypothetical protein
LSDLNDINREELRGLVQEGLVDWLQQAKTELESQGVDFSDGVDGEEIGKILSYGGERLRGAFEDILSRFGGDDLGSEEEIDIDEEEVGEIEDDASGSRRRATSDEIDRVKENYKYAVIKGTKDYGSLDRNEKELYDIFFGRSRRSLREDTFSSQPLETLEDIFRLGWNVVEEVFDGTIDFMRDFSEAVFEDCMDWDDHDETFGPFTLDYGDGGDFGLGDGGWNPLNWIPDVGVIELTPEDINFGCIPEEFFKLLVKHLKRSSQQIGANTIYTILDVFEINEPYPEWIERGIEKMQEIGLISQPSAIEKMKSLPGSFADLLNEQSVSFKEFEKIIQNDIINDQKLRK